MSSPTTPPRKIRRQQPSLLISWLGWEDGLVAQDVVKVRRGETEELAVATFAANPRVAKVVKVEAWS
jgi:hypothetical protein